MLKDFALCRHTGIIGHESVDENFTILTTKIYQQPWTNNKFSIN